MNYTCPVCFYDAMQEPACDYNICVCCGTEFGNDDELCTHAELRARWIATGAKWFYKNPPLTWNPWNQLYRANVSLPYRAAVEFVGVTSLSFNQTKVAMTRADSYSRERDALGAAA